MKKLRYLFVLCVMFIFVFPVTADEGDIYSEEILEKKLVRQEIWERILKEDKISLPKDMQEEFEIAKQYPELWEKVEFAEFYHVFPEAKLYLYTFTIIMVTDGPPSKVAFVHYKNNFYIMPAEFNHLMLDYGLRINEETIVPLAKALIIATKAASISEIKFRPKIKRDIEVEPRRRVIDLVLFTYSKELPSWGIGGKISAGDVEEEWRFTIIPSFKYMETLKNSDSPYDQDNYKEFNKIGPQFTLVDKVIFIEGKDRRIQSIFINRWEPQD